MGTLFDTCLALLLCLHKTKWYICLHEDPIKVHWWEFFNTTWDVLGLGLSTHVRELFMFMLILSSHYTCHVTPQQNEVCMWALTTREIVDCFVELSSTELSTRVDEFSFCYKYDPAVVAHLGDLIINTDNHTVTQPKKDKFKSSRLPVLVTVVEALIWYCSRPDVWQAGSWSPLLPLSSYESSLLGCCQPLSAWSCYAFHHV